MAVYARISDDAEDEGLGVRRQEKDGVALCGLRGWVPEVYVDNDLSAYKKAVVRPEFERMLADLQAGRIGGVVAYNIDRLFRQPRDLERLIDVYDEKPGLTFATVEGDINLATADGRTMARVMVAFANKASADTGRRTRRKHLELAQQGKPVGRRTWGWQNDEGRLGLALEPVESARARRLVDDLLNGAPLRVLTAQLNDEGMRTTTGGLWSHQTLRNYLRNPRLVGLRTHKGQVVRDEHGEPVKGTWEPLLDQVTFDRVQIALAPRVGMDPSGRRGARKYHLSGLVRCGRCHRSMYGSKARETGRFNYICNNSAAESSDRHIVAGAGTAIDALVDEMVFAYLQRRAVQRSTPAETWEKQARYDEVQVKMRTLMDAYMANTLSSETVLPRVAALEAEFKVLKSERVAWLYETTGPEVKPETAESWRSKTPDERRAVADKVLRAVYVRPAERRSGTFDRRRLDPVWVED